MKFVNYLEGITGVGIYPLISLLIFFVFFTVLAIWAVRVSKGYIDTMERIPFTEDENN